jgi:hypothetical protein
MAQNTGYRIGLGNSPFLRMPVTLYATFIITLIMKGGGEREKITQIIQDFGGDFIPLNQSPI